MKSKYQSPLQTFLSYEKYLNIKNYEWTFIIPYVKKKKKHVGKCLETSCS